ncbi:type IA DNA topoisomerase [bacterium]|nr:type IA DNA topoisomerase [bacterium]
MNLVNAQLARLIFDKLFGFKTSSFAYKLMKLKDLSIGRVQSEALQIIVNRENEIKNYIPKYW